MPPKAAAASRENKEHGDTKDTNEQLYDIQQNIEKILKMLVSGERKLKSVENLENFVDSQENRMGRSSI